MLSRKIVASFSIKNIDTKQLIRYYLMRNMATFIGSGISSKLDSFLAGKEAANSAYYQLGRRNPDIIITFISTIYDQTEVIRGVRAIMKDIPLAGCSTAGSMQTSGSFKSTVSVFTISSDSLSFSYGVGSEVNRDSRAAGHKAAIEASNSAKALKQVYIMFSDSLYGNAADILRGAQEVLGTSFPIIGGSSVDDRLFQKTYQYLNDDVYTEAVVGLLLSGNMKIGIGESSGWQPIGRPHKITKAKSNIIKEIDKKDAIEIYEDYFEKTFDELRKDGIIRLGLNYPLGIRNINKKKDYVIRIPLKVEDNGSIILSADILEDEEISLMIGDKNLILEAASQACREAIKHLKNPDIKFAVIFSDIARLQLLRKDSQKEIEIIKEILGKNVPLLGCYTCGEYAPLDLYESRGQSYFNNQGITIAVFSE